VEVDVFTHTLRRLYTMPSEDTRGIAAYVQNAAQNGWYLALLHAQTALDESQRRTSLLKDTVRRLREEVDSGEPFPAQERLSASTKKRRTVPVQREMERERSPLVSNTRPSGGGFSRHLDIL
jgi:hypothetical protein